MEDLALKRQYWASVSGGKDSLYMLKYIIENPDKYRLDGVVHYELSIDYPFIKDVIKYMEAECKKFGIKFWSIKPKTEWYEELRKKGFPSGKVRWCNRWKRSAEEELREWLLKQNVKPVLYIGFCADEVKRFKVSLFDRDVDYIYPLAEAGIEEKTILEWAKSVDIFNGYYQYCKRCGCMWCPLQSLQESLYLYRYYPDKYFEIMREAQKTEHEVEKKTGRPISVWQGKAKYNTEYRLKRVLELDQKERTTKKGTL